MSNQPEPDNFLRNIAFIVIAFFTLSLIYVSEPAGPFSLFFKSALVAIIKMCLWAADYVHDLGESIFRDWQSDPQHRFPFPARPPLHIVYALKGCEFVADMLRYIGSLLARGAISFRNHGSANPFTLWPARILLTTRGLFLNYEGFVVSFTSTWATKVWPFSLT